MSFVEVASFLAMTKINKSEIEHPTLRSTLERLNKTIR